MEILFIRAPETIIPFTLERQMMKTVLLMANGYNPHTPSLRNMMVYKNRALANGKQVIQNYKYYYSQFDQGYTAEQLDTFIYILTYVKNKKFKTRDELIRMGIMERNLVKLRMEVERAGEQWLNDNLLDSVINFLDDNSLAIYDESADKEKDEQFYVNLLLKEIVDNANFFLVAKNKEIVKENYEKHEPLTAEQVDTIFSSTLFQIPSLDSLSYNQLRIIRNDIMEALIPFYKAIEELKTKFSKMQLTFHNMNEIEALFDSVIDPQTAFFKELMENNIYIQQIKNSVDNPILYQMNISFSSIKLFLEIQENFRVISEMEKQGLLEKIAHTTDINTVMLFFNISEIELQ